MYKNFIIPVVLLLLGGMAVSLAVRSAPVAENSDVARRVNPCAPRADNPCAAGR